MTPTESSSMPGLAAVGLRSTHTRRVVLLAAGFWLVFASFGTAQLLQSSVNASVGLSCLALIYVPLALMSLVAPQLLSASTGALTAALPACASLYAIMVAANIEPAAGPLLVSCAGVGLAAAVFWSAQSLYVQRCAAAYANAQGLPLTRAASYQNSVFFSVLASSGAVSSAIAAVFFLAMDAAAVPSLFIFMTALGVAGVVLLAFLPEPGDESTDAVFRVPCAARCAARRKAGVASLPAAATSNAPPPPSSEAPGVSLIVSAAAAAGSASGDVRDDWHAMSVDAADTVGGTPERAIVKAAPAPASTAAPAAALTVESAASSAIVPAVSPAAAPNAAPVAAPVAAPDCTPAPSPPASQLVPVVVPTPLFMLRFIISEPRMRWAVPLILEHGMMQGVFNGAVLGSLARSDGLTAVCIIGAVQSVGAVAANVAWHRPLQRASHGRRWAFVWAFAAHAAFVSCLLAWALAAPAPAPGAQLEDRVSDPRLLAAAVALALLYAAGDTVFFSQIPATLQTFFPAAPQAPCAMAAIRLFSSASNATATLTSLALGPQRFAIQYAMTLASIGAAAAATWHLHAHIASLDGQQRATPAAESGGAETKAAAVSDCGLSTAATAPAKETVAGAGSESAVAVRAADAAAAAPMSPLAYVVEADHAGMGDDDVTALDSPPGIARGGDDDGATAWP